MSKTINVYLPSADDFDCEGLGTLCPLDWEYVNKGIGGAILTITHPYDAEGRWQWLAAGNIIRADVPVRTVPEIDNGALVATAEHWTVKAGATKAQRYIYSSKASGKGKKKKLVPAGATIAVTYKGDDRYAVNYRAQVKSRRRWVWKCWSGWMDPEALDVKVDTVDTSTVAKVEENLPSVQVRPQLFRLQQPKRKEKTIEIDALPIAYDAAGILTDPFTGTVCTGPQALQRILQYAYMDTDLELYTDIGDSRTGFDKRNVNIIDALLNGDDSFVGRWGGDVLLDDNAVTILRSAGVDRGFYATYGRNLTGVDSYEISDDVVTAILPVGENADGTPLYLSGQKYVESSNAGQFPTPHMVELKVSDAKVDTKSGVTVAIARTRMQAAVAAEWEKGVHIPAITLKIDYAMLGDSEEYRAFKDIDQCHMYDTVHVWHPLVCGYVDMAVCECTWNGMKERYTETTLGTPGGTLSSAKISAGSISGSITGRQIAWNTVGAGQLADDAISARHVQADSVNADAIQAESVTAGKVAAGAITTEKLDAGAVTADKLAANAVTAAKIDAHSVSAAVVQTTEFSAASANIADARIGSADIDFAQIKYADVNQLIAQDAITQRFFIEKLQVLSAQIAEATVGQLVVKAADGNYYSLDIAYDNGGNPQITPTLRTTTAAEIAAGMTSDGRASIIETDLTVADLAAGNLKAINALIDTLTAGRLYANQAFINELHTSLITDEDFVNVVVTANGKADPMTDSDSGYPVEITDSANAALGGLTIYGRSEQGMRITGKNLLPLEAGDASASGLTYKIQLDGGIHISGTATGTTGLRFHYNNALNIPAGTYRFLLTGSGTGFDNVTLQLYTDTGAGYASRNYAQDFTYTITAAVSGDYVRIHCAAGTYDCTVYPMMMLSSETDTTFEPCSNGMPAPNPTFQCPVSSAGMTLGKNIYRDIRGGMTSGDVTFTPQADGGLHISGTASAVIQYNPYTDYTILNLPHGIYRFAITGSGTGVENVMMQLYVNNNGNGLKIATGWNLDTNWVYTIRNEAIADAVRIRIAAGSYDCVVYPMIVPSPYIDYTTYEAPSDGAPQGTQIALTSAGDNQQSHTVALPTPNGLPGIPVSSGGNHTDGDGQQWICDTIDLASGTYTQRCKVAKIDAVDSITVDGFIKIDFSDSAAYITVGAYDAILCNAYAPTTDDSYASAPDKSIRIGGTRGGLFIKDTAINASASTAQAFFDSHDVYVVYPLNTPVTTPLTDAQLQALRSLHTYAGETTLSNDCGADMDVVYATQAGGGSYVEGVRQGLDDGVNAAQAAADNAQASADAAAATADALNDIFNMWYSFTDEGMIVQKRREDGTTASIWSTLTDNEGFHIRRADLAEKVFSAYKDRCRVQKLVIGNTMIKASGNGGMVWVKAPQD